MASRDRSTITLELEDIVVSQTAQQAGTALDVLLTSRFETKYPAIADQWRKAISELGPFFALAPRLRRLMQAGESEAESLHRRLARSVARHGAFADGEAALAFVGRVLERAQREVDACDGFPGSLVARSPPGAEPKVQRTRCQQL